MKGDKALPYHKNKQQAFQAAQQGMKDVTDIFQDIVKDDPDYGHHLKQLKNEINEAYQQIENALEVASETQRGRLMQFKHDLESIVDEVNRP